MSTKIRRWGFLSFAFVVILFTSSLASAQSVPWDENYRKVSALEKALTASYLAGTIGLQLTGNHYADPFWTGPVGPDTYFHDLLSQTNTHRREEAASVSDGLLLLTAAYPVMESAFVALGRSSPEAAGQMFWIAAHTQSLVLFATTFTKFAVKRERPGHDECYDSDDPSCEQRESLSFFSGHASTTFAAAGVACANEQHLDIYSSNGWLNMIPCALLSLSAVTTGTLRIVANKHYFTDVFTGAVIGGGLGYFLPTFLNYTSAQADEVGVTLKLVPTATSDRAVLSLLGEW